MNTTRNSNGLSSKLVGLVEEMMVFYLHTGEDAYSLDGSKKVLPLCEQGKEKYA